MRPVYVGGLGYEISCVLSREGDVGAWVLLCRPGHLQVDRMTTNFKAGINWHAFEYGGGGLGLDWGTRSRVR